ncbi:tyrosine-type recombinase/integrase [Planomonospora venezuelensis]|uniref:Site-specific recombinase XerD n=1 Tax=Planomonospora venezuelensis TaxID=1999 RepID=A0A841DHT3_PLAVE|nr:tyrosine-type recombinase/integrase [Planomonospora venezuelensis]MBB5967868.1 site-specific recombinase XerD [Planomonospora venezuelensis]GIN03268.1 site-specific integrase [Planomonospora venezuelensis]
MPKQRAHGDGGLYWSESRQRWIAEMTIGYSPAGRRITRKAAGRTKTEAKAKLKEMLRDHDDGLTVAAGRDTVAEAVRNWLEFGLSGRAESTVNTKRILAEKHIIPELGARKLRELTADDVDRWLARTSKKVSTRTLQELRSILKRSLVRAQARDKVKRNVVLLCELPKGKAGRPSKALTMEQAMAVLEANETAKPWLHAYILVSLLVGLRTEEVRDLSWAYVVAFDQETVAWATITEIGWDHQEFGIYVWRSDRVGGDTKTITSRRTLKLPQRCVTALRKLWDHQAKVRETAGDAWEDNDLVFATRTGTKLSSANVRREFRRVIARAGLTAKEWTPREMRHSFVSLLSADGVPIEHIARLVGHAGGSAVTEKVYRQQIRPVIQEGATVMDRIFPGGQRPSAGT